MKKRSGQATLECALCLPLWLLAWGAIWILHDVTLGRFEATRVLRESLVEHNPDRAVANLNFERSTNPLWGSMDIALNPLFRTRQAVLPYQPFPWLKPVLLEGAILDVGSQRERLWLWVASLGVASSF